eukprot:746782-Hanusia_phi.AAC.2
MISVDRTFDCKHTLLLPPCLRKSAPPLLLHPPPPPPFLRFHLPQAPPSLSCLATPRGSRAAGAGGEERSDRARSCQRRDDLRLLGSAAASRGRRRKGQDRSSTVCEHAPAGGEAAPERL